MRVFYSIGYEGINFKEFLKFLKEYNIKLIVDVRKIAFSWKRDFNKRILEDKLNLNGIRYIHLSQLGTPNELRKEYKKDKDIRKLLIKYNNYLDKNKKILGDLIKILQEHSSINIAIMCFEKNTLECHRSIIILKLLELKVIDEIRDVRNKDTTRNKIFCFSKNLS